MRFYGGLINGTAGAKLGVGLDATVGIFQIEPGGPIQGLPLVFKDLEINLRHGLPVSIGSKLLDDDGRVKNTEG